MVIDVLQIVSCLLVAFGIDFVVWILFPLLFCFFFSAVLIDRSGGNKVPGENLGSDNFGSADVTSAVYHKETQ